MNGEGLCSRFAMLLTGFLAFHSPSILEPNDPRASTNLAPPCALALPSHLDVRISEAGFL